MQTESDRDKHFTQLREAYRAVGDRTWLAEDFDSNNLEVSRNLYTPESLQARAPEPKALEVYALLSGLPFAEDFTGQLVSVQRQISEVLGDCLHYWVAPQNLGVEYCVFKWPDDQWQEQWQDVVQKTLASMRPQAFQFHINGVQINPDGCVVARGFDDNAGLFKLRAQLKQDIEFLPEKQSGWAHVPLGRILEPLGAERFGRLARLMESLSDRSIATTTITNVKFIHETQWYMERRTTLAEYSLAEESM